MRTSFKTKLSGSGNNAGIEVPEANIKELGSSKEPPVNVEVNGYKYKSTAAVMGGKYMISFAKTHRDATGLSAKDSINVVLELDSGVREVEIPTALKTALDNANLFEVFNQLAYSKRKEHARQVNEAKAEDTRDRRIEKIIATLSEASQE
jgi:hypothetical protein